MKSFENKVAVVTGGGSGIGAALARESASRGMRVAVADINLQDAEDVCSTIQRNGGQAQAFRTDVSSAVEVEQLATRIRSQWGAVNLLCANAGIVPGGRHRAVWEYATEDWTWAFGVNVMGVVHAIRSFVPDMIQHGEEGHVLITASIAGFISGSGSPVYGSSKHAAVRIGEALYASFAERSLPLGVSLLCPGLVNTKIYESERSRPEAFQLREGAPSESEDLKAIAPDMYARAPQPEAIAKAAFDGVSQRRLYVIPTESFDPEIEARMRAVLARQNPVFSSLLSLSKRDVSLD